MNTEALEEAFKSVQKRLPEAKPVCGVILGSGWSDVISAFELHETIPYGDIPGLGRTGVAGHAGRLAWATSSGVETLIFQGRRHGYEGEGWTPIAIPIYILKQLGARFLLLTNAAGGIRSDLVPGSLMIMDDHINNFPSNPLSGPHDPMWGPRFLDQTEVYDAPLRDALEHAGKNAGENLARGVYLGSEGPTYETPAEIRAYRTLGADAVGMSTIPEAILGNAAGLRVVALSCITNLAAGISQTKLTHEEVTETTQMTMPRMKAVLEAFWKELAHVK